MKKTVSLILSLLLAVGFVFPVFSFAEHRPEKEIFEDGSYIETVCLVKESSSADFFSRLMDFFRRLIEFFTGQRTVTKTKYVSYYSSEDELLWTASLKAEFVYSDKKAICTDSKFGIDIYDSDWVLLSSENTEDNDKATAEFTVQQYKLGVPLKTINRSITLICDTKGNVR
ncbi:MAG: hypothetical protein IJO68_00690 [Clostridia bacterium]|nr:hypothetical protein [Clostridia bacterium]